MIRMLTVTLIGFLVSYLQCLICVFVNRWDPKKRFTPEQATRHEWLQPSQQVKTPSNQPPSPLSAPRPPPHLPPIAATDNATALNRNKVDPPALTVKASAMTNSVSDLESAHQYSLYRLYHGKKTLNKLGAGGAGSVHPHGSMHHSQSTGDVSAMFGQA